MWNKRKNEQELMCTLQCFSHTSESIENHQKRTTNLNKNIPDECSVYFA